MRIEAFTRYNEMTGDAYVMDYTQATAGKRKVCIKEEDPDDIASFHFLSSTYKCNFLGADNKQ